MYKGRHCIFHVGTYQIATNLHNNLYLRTPDTNGCTDSAFLETIDEFLLTKTAYICDGSVLM